MINSKEKGKRGERAFAKYLRDLGVESARRGQQFKGGEDSPDVIGVEGVHFEVKVGKGIRIREAYAQACRDAKATDIPVVAFKVDRKPWAFVVRYDHLKPFNERVNRARGVKEPILHALPFWDSFTQFVLVGW